MEEMHNIKFEVLADGTVSLQQETGHEGPDTIWLHPEQLKFITRRVAGMPEATAAQVADLERRLSALMVGLESFACDSDVRGTILHCCHDGGELIERLDGLVNLAWEFSGVLTPGDLRRSPPSDQDDQPATTTSAKPKNATKRDGAHQPALDL